MSKNINRISQEDRWEIKLNLVIKYFNENGRLPQPKDNENGGTWLDNQRDYFKHNKLNSERVEKLNTLLPGWDVLPTSFKQDAVWFENFERVVSYYNKNGIIPGCLDKENGGNWLAVQRSKFNQNELREDRIALLDEKVPSWRKKRKIMSSPHQEKFDEEWDEKFYKVVNYYKINGKLPEKKDKENCGTWLVTQRYLFKKGELREDRILKLNSLLPGWSEDRHSVLSEDIWMSNFEKVVNYYKINNILPQIGDSSGLGSWLSNQRRMLKDGLLDDEKKVLLDKNVPFWTNPEVFSSSYAAWLENFEILKNYYVANGDFPPTCDLENSGVWLNRQRYFCRIGKLGDLRKKKLDEEFPNWFEARRYKKDDELWESRLAVVIKYYEENGKLPSQEDAVNGGRWLGTQRNEFYKGTLSEYRKQRLDEEFPKWYGFKKKVIEIHSAEKFEVVSKNDDKNVSRVRKEIKA